MKNALTAVTLAALVTLAGVSAKPSHAQNANAKQELAAKVVNLQQGPELDRLVEQLAAGTTQELLQNWGPKVDAAPAARQTQIKEALNAELQKYSDDVIKVIGSKVAKASTEALVPAYAERFTTEELQQIAAFFESPAIKKYQSVAPELGNVFVQKLVESTRADVATRVEQFNTAATKIVGTSATSKAAPSAKDKPAAKR